MVMPCLITTSRRQSRPARPDCWGRRRKCRSRASCRGTGFRRRDPRQTRALPISTYGARCSAAAPNSFAATRSASCAVGDDRPRHDDMVRSRSRPFEIGDRDPAMNAVGDRLQHAVMRQRGGIAVALDVQVPSATWRARRRRPARVRRRPARRALSGSGTRIAAAAAASIHAEHGVSIAPIVRQPRPGAPLTIA